MMNPISDDVNHSFRRIDHIVLPLHLDVDQDLMVFYIVDAILFSIGIVTNLLTLLIISAHAKLRSLSSAFFILITAGDFARGIVGLVLAVAMVHGLSTGDWTFFLPKSVIALEFTLWMSTGLGYHSISLITVERWLFIAYPFHHRRWVTKRTMIVCVVATVLTSALTSAFGIIYELLLICVIYIFPIMQTIYCILIIAIYGHIVVITRRQISAISDRPAQASVLGMEATVAKGCFFCVGTRNWKAMRMAFVIFTLFFVTITPWIYFQAYRAIFEVKTKASGQISQFLGMISCCNFCSNIFIYYTHNKEFRDVIRCYLSRVRGLCCSGNRQLRASRNPKRKVGS